MSTTTRRAAPQQSTLLPAGDLTKIEAGVREAVKLEIVVLDINGHPVSR